MLVPIYYEAVRERYIQDGKFAYAETIDDAVRARNSQWMANQSLFDRFLRPMLTFIEGFVFAATPILSLLIPIGALGIGAVGRFPAGGRLDSALDPGARDRQSVHPRRGRSQNDRRG